MHWAVRVKKEPMLEASKVEPSATSKAAHLPVDEEAPKIFSHEAAPSSSKPV